MTTDLEPLELLNGHPKVASWDTEERFPGAYRLHLVFTNGREASIITGPGLFFRSSGTLEIAALTSDGDLDFSTDVIGSDVRRGTPEEILDLALALADLPPEGRELDAAAPLEGEIIDPNPAHDVVANLRRAVDAYRNPAPRALIQGLVLCAHCAGNGRLQGGTCIHCNGTGEVPK